MQMAIVLHLINEERVGPIHHKVKVIVQLQQRYSQMYQRKVEAFVEEMQESIGQAEPYLQGSKQLDRIKGEISEYQNWSTQVEEIIPSGISLDPYTSKKVSYDQLQLWNQQLQNIQFETKMTAAFKTLVDDVEQLRVVMGGHPSMDQIEESRGKYSQLPILFSEDEEKEWFGQLNQNMGEFQEEFMISENERFSPLTTPCEHCGNIHQLGEDCIYS